MYTPRLLDNQLVNHSVGLTSAIGGNPAVSSVILSTVIDSTSDSAVSSMGSDGWIHQMPPTRTPRP
jgi:hypothetical protein